MFVVNSGRKSTTISQTDKLFCNYFYALKYSYLWTIFGIEMLSVRWKWVSSVYRELRVSLQWIICKFMQIYLFVKKT